MNSEHPFLVDVLSTGRVRMVPMFLIILVVVMGLIMGFTFASAHEGTGMRDAIRKGPHARQIAESGLLMAVREVNRNPAWRTEHAHGMWVKDHPFAGGRFSVSAKDEDDGDLADNPEDPVKLTAWGEYYGSVHEVSAVLTPRWPVRNVLLVVPNPQSLTAEQQARRELLEQMGVEVELTGPGQVTARVEYAPTAVDAIYLVAGVTDVALGGRLGSIPTPILAECRGDDRDFLDELALATTTAAYRQGRTLRLAGGNHPLVAAFAPGPMQMFDGLQPMVSLPATSLGAGARVLAEDSAGGVRLAAYESGSALIDGQAAPARRVVLGWGGAGLDPHALTADGRALMERAVRWAIEGGPADGLGLARAGGAWRTGMASQQLAVPVRVATPGRLHSISLFVAAAEGTRVAAAVYADAEGVPGRLIAEGPAVELSGGESGWVTVPLGPVTLSPGRVWLAAGLGPGVQQVAGSRGGEAHLVVHNAIARGFLAEWGSRQVSEAWTPSLFASFVAGERRGTKRLQDRQTFTLRWIETR